VAGDQENLPLPSLGRQRLRSRALNEILVYANMYSLINKVYCIK
jgi:hypothetical protein